MFFPVAFTSSSSAGLFGGSWQNILKDESRTKRSNARRSCRHSFPICASRSVPDPALALVDNVGESPPSGRHWSCRLSDGLRTVLARVLFASRCARDVVRGLALRRDSLRLEHNSVDPRRYRSWRCFLQPFCSDLECEHRHHVLSYRGVAVASFALVAQPFGRSDTTRDRGFASGDENAGAT